MLLACSPRREGNGDAAARLVRQAFAAATPCGPPLFLRDHTVLSCLSCGQCARRKGYCPLADRDDTPALFAALLAAPALVLIAPIYFYHVPAQLKSLMDRSQMVWMLREKWGDPPPPRKQAHVILMGARQQGANLFTGSLLSIRYWLDLFGYDLAPPLTLFGLDGPDDLQNSPEKRTQVAAYAQHIGNGISRDGAFV